MTSAIAFQNQNNFVLGRPKLALENQNPFSPARKKVLFPRPRSSRLRSGNPARFGLRDIFSDKFGSFFGLLELRDILQGNSENPRWG